MKILTWNVKGLGTYAKILAIRRLLRGQKVELAMLQETKNNMEKACFVVFEILMGVPEILEKYWQQRYSSPADIPGDETQTLYQEVLRLKAKYESLQRSQSHLLGEELETLTIKELYKIEKQLDRALSHARQKKMQLLWERMEELNKKERELEDENMQLKSQLGSERCFQPTQGLGDPNIEVSTGYDMIPSQANHAHQQPSIQMGYTQFIPQDRVSEDGLVNSGGNKRAAGWL
ncbi:hypothetical protein V6N11_059125 [Hibiscus sabdariffa]|uniref:K-box domain-containing protein n=1 Tax=Hibiscus sabdariffa TaxID=183260 RepID=A0ABR2U681_9ROSI